MHIWGFGVGRSVSHREGLGAEHPLNDKVQAIFLVLFLIVWISDSFTYRFSTVLAATVPVLVRLPLVFFAFTLGIYLGGKSLSAVFGRTLVRRIGEPRLITTGVYSWVRHPMYLGGLLFLLGFFFATLSLLSLGVLFGLFLFYDKMATYEERDLCRILGEQYLNYQIQVPKWLPRKKERRGGNQLATSAKAFRKRINSLNARLLMLFLPADSQLVFFLQLFGKMVRTKMLRKRSQTILIFRKVLCEPSQLFIV
jgi:protein-S-isoprenylcysteine O-methyltransferase Ste14